MRKSREAGKKTSRRPIPQPLPTGENPPNMTGDTRWQWTYTLLIFIGAFALAIAATYLVEHPAAKRIMALQPKEKQNQKKEREPWITIETIDPEPEEDDLPETDEQMENTNETEEHQET